MKDILYLMDTIEKLSKQIQKAENILNEAVESRNRTIEFMGFNSSILTKEDKDFLFEHVIKYGLVIIRAENIIIETNNEIQELIDLIEEEPKTNHQFSIFGHKIEIIHIKYFAIIFIVGLILGMLLF